MMLRYILLILLFIDVDGIEVRVGDVVSVNHRQAVVDGRNKDGSVDLYYTDNGSYHRNIKKNQLSSVVMSFTSKKEETSHFKSAFVDKLTHSQSNLLYRLAKLFNLEEEEDDDLLATALRETDEELDIKVDPGDVLGRLPIVNTRLGFEITPFVSVLSSVPEYEPAVSEVGEVLEIPFTTLLSTQQRDVGSKPSEEGVMYWFQHHRIWGASAKILNQIGHLATY